METWNKIPGGLIHVSGNLNYIWGVNKAGSIYLTQRPCSGHWKQIGGRLIQLDVDDYSVWGINSGHSIYVRPVDGSGGWKCIGGKLMHISASGSGYVWGVNSAHQIFKCKKPCNGHWIRVNGLLKQIDGGEREVCGVNRGGHVYCRPVDGSGRWRGISGGFKYVTASSPYDLYGISTKNELFRCKKPCIGQWIRVGTDKINNLNQCDGSPNALFGIDASHSIWRKDFPL